jgi:hypothetical protein
VKFVSHKLDDILAETLFVLRIPKSMPELTKKVMYRKAERLGLFWMYIVYNSR